MSPAPQFSPLCTVYLRVVAGQPGQAGVGVDTGVTPTNLPHIHLTLAVTANIDWSTFISFIHSFYESRIISILW